MSTKARAVLEQIVALAPEEQRDVLHALTSRLAESAPNAKGELHGEDLTDEDIADAARVTFSILDQEEQGAATR
jgi:hypothetical protein